MTLKTAQLPPACRHRANPHVHAAPPLRQPRAWRWALLMHKKAAVSASPSVSSLSCHPGSHPAWFCVCETTRYPQTPWGGGRGTESDPAAICMVDSNDTLFDCFGCFLAFSSQFRGLSYQSSHGGDDLPHHSDKLLQLPHAASCLSPDSPSTQELSRSCLAHMQPCSGPRIC